MTPDPQAMRIAELEHQLSRSLASAVRSARENDRLKAELREMNAECEEWEAVYKRAAPSEIVDRAYAALQENDKLKQERDRAWNDGWDRGIDACAGFLEERGSIGADLIGEMRRTFRAPAPAEMEGQGTCELNGPGCGYCADVRADLKAVSQRLTAEDLAKLAKEGEQLRDACYERLNEPAPVPRGEECPDCGHARARCGEDCACNCDAAHAEEESSRLRVERDSLRAELERIRSERNGLHEELSRARGEVDRASNVATYYREQRDRADQDIARVRAQNERMRAVLSDASKALNNIGVEFAGPSSNPQHQKDINRLRAIFERWNIQEYRFRDALSDAAETKEDSDLTRGWRAGLARAARELENRFADDASGSDNPRNKWLASAAAAIRAAEMPADDWMVSSFEREREQAERLKVAEMVRINIAKALDEEAHIEAQIFVRSIDIAALIAEEGK